VSLCELSLVVSLVGRVLVADVPYDLWLSIIGSYDSGARNYWKERTIYQ
jgi:hypothetical protein